MALSIFSYFQVNDKRVDQIAEHLIAQQMEDRGWNCRSYKGDTHASFNTTLLVLEGLREYQNYRPKSKLPIADAIKAGQEFLLQHQIYKSHRTGKIVSDKYLRTPAQPSWQYDFLRALEHFAFTSAKRDKRLKDAMALLVSRRDADGRWAQYRPAAGKYFFQMEAAGKPSRWNTLRALRVLKWWEAK